MPRRMTEAERDRFLAGRHVAVLVTTSADGRPVPTPIWYLYRDGKLYFRTGSDSAKVANVRRDPRVAVCVQEERAPYKAVVVRGTAELRPDPEWLQAETPRHYLGFVGAIGYQMAASSAIEQGPPVAIVVTPERITTWDYTPETPWFGRLWLVFKRVLPPWL
ncbi:MAG: PPOX class F420-dependent oxidoreductase [Dehalococcoidia bacterium]